MVCGAAVTAVLVCDVAALHVVVCSATFVCCASDVYRAAAVLQSAISFVCGAAASPTVFCAASSCLYCLCFYCYL